MRDSVVIYFIRDGTSLRSSWLYFAIIYCEISAGQAVLAKRGGSEGKYDEK